MARIRTVKPEFFRHENLFDLERETGLPIRLAFAGLWTACDREGRFKWNPRNLKLDALPYDDVDFSRVLDALATRGFIVRYRSTTENGARDYGYIPSWKDHQVINVRERASVLPNPNECEVIDYEIDACPTRAPRVTSLHVHARGEGKGREGEEEGKEDKILGHEQKSSNGTGKTQSVGEAAKAAIEKEFLEFWAEYPKKQSKPTAQKAYTKARGSVSHETIIAGLKRAIASDSRFRDRQFTPMPATWLNSGGWMDETEAKPSFRSLGIA